MAAALSAGSALRQSLHRELSHLRRNRWDLGFITLLPLVGTLLIAWLLSAGVMRQVPVALVDDDHSATSRALARALDASPGVKLVSQPVDMGTAQSQLRQLEVFAILHVPEGLARRTLRGQAAQVYAFYNATYMTTGQAVAREIGEAVTAFNGTLLQGEVAAMASPSTLRLAPVAVQTRMLYNPARNFALFLFPMITAAVLSLGMTLATVAAFGRELRSPGTWAQEQPWAAAVGKLLPYLGVFWLQVLLALGYAAFCVGDGVAGSVLLLIVSVPLFLLASAGIGLLFLGLTRDMGVSLSLVGVMMGTALAFSGGTFPVVDGPLFTRLWNSLLPLTPWLEWQNQQLLVGTLMPEALAPLGVLLLIVLVCVPLGLWRLFATLRRPGMGEAGA